MKIEYQMNEFLNSCVEKGLSKKTCKSYEQTLILFALYLKKTHKIEDAAKVKTEMIREYLQYIKERGKYTVVGKEHSRSYNFPENRTDYGKKVSDVTINNYLRNIKVFFHFLEETQLIKKNPTEKIRQIKTTRKPLHFMDDSEYQKLMSSIDISKSSEYRDYVLINTLLDTGMRLGECLKIQIEDLDFKEKTIYLPAENTKGKRSRFVFFSQKLAAELKRWLQYKDRYIESNYIFPTIRGTVMQVSNFEANLTKYAKRADLKNIHPHMLRNNFAKRFLMSGGDIYTLSKILGHSSVEVTEKEYLDLDTKDLHRQYAAHSPLTHIQTL